MRKRERYLDIAKGCGILSIVLLHFTSVDSLSSIRTFIGLYMISVFYVIVGWIDAMRPAVIPINEIIRKRWKQLGIPYIGWTIIILIFDMFLWAFGYYSTTIIAREIYKSIVLRGIGTLWFLPALLGGELLFHHIVKKQNKIWLTIGMIILALLYNELYFHIFGHKTDTMSRIIEAPFHTINNVLNAFLFITGGYVLCLVFKRYEDTFKQYVWGTIGMIICICMFWWTYNIHIPVIGLKIVSLLTPFGIILFVKYIQNARCLDYLNFWGKHSLGLMVTHYSLLLPICVIIQNYIYHTEALRLHGWISIFCFFSIMILEYYLVLYIEKKYPKLIGK